MADLMESVLLLVGGNAGDIEGPFFTPNGWFNAMSYVIGGNVGDHV